jgi:hypothetical protein
VRRPDPRPSTVEFGRASAQFPAATRAMQVARFDECESVAPAAITLRFELIHPAPDAVFVFGLVGTKASAHGAAFDDFIH